jgi:hypothetical protein
VSHDPAPSQLTVHLSSLVDLSVEHWRLARWLDSVAPGSSAALARHALRRMGDFLKSQGLEARSLDGEIFDAGMAVKVIDVVDDPGLAEGKSVVEETVSPLVSWRGQVVRPGEVVTRRGAKR